METDRPSPRAAARRGLLIGLVVLPIYIIVSLRSSDGEALAAAVAAAMLVIAALVFWRFRRYVWFWLVLALLALGHAVMVARVPWQWTNRLTAPEVWPLGMGDLLIDVGCIRLVAWLVGMRARS